MLTKGKDSGGETSSIYSSFDAQSEYSGSYVRCHRTHCYPNDSSHCQFFRKDFSGILEVQLLLKYVPNNLPSCIPTVTCERSGGDVECELHASTTRPDASIQ